MASRCACSVRVETGIPRTNGVKEEFITVDVGV